MILRSAIIFLLAGTFVVLCASVPERGSSTAAGECYPALGFPTRTSQQPPDSLNDWWCDPASEYAFLGFSYEISTCQSLKQLRAEFFDIRNTFRSRYVRLYGACDKSDYYDNIIQAAWENTLGVHALIWFGFDGSDKWKTRRDNLFVTLHTNPLAKFVTRTVQFGSEPLYDDVLTPAELTEQVIAAKANLSNLNIPLTVSELAYGYQERGGAQDLLDAIDSVNIHMLPFFDANATIANNSWPNVLNDLDFFVNHANSKKLYFDENGWPSSTSPSVQPNSPDAVANVQNEHDYFELLDQQCEYLKEVEGGGVGWFMHIYSDNQEPGYGLYDDKGNMKFTFNPRTQC